MSYGYIYLITNKVNGKQYVGQTSSTIEDRWKKHLDNAKNNPSKQIITQAISKYGKENFEIEELARVKVEDLNDIEIFFIKKYDTFQNGYNMTIGGENSWNSISEEIYNKIIELALNDFTNVSKIARDCNVSPRVVKRVLDKENISIKNFDKGSLGNIENLKPYFGLHNDNLVKPCPVKIVELNKSFSSMIECARWLIENNLTKTKNEINVMKSISRLFGNDSYRRDTYCELHFEKL